MAQEQKCSTSLSFDLSFFNRRALCSIGIVSFVFIANTITSFGVGESSQKMTAIKGGGMGM